MNWLHKNGYEEVKESTFVPRKVYGDYVQATLNEAEANARAYVMLERIVDETYAIQNKSDNLMVKLSSGECLQVQKAVLALGNFPASLPKPVASLENHSHNIRNAWSSDARADLNPEDSILLIGTGLTMVDAVVALHQKGFPGKIHAVSRHGLKPYSHKTITPLPTFIDVKTAPKTATSAFGPPLPR